MSKILVPTDFSEQAQNALAFAVKLAPKINAKIDVLNVVEYNVGVTADPVGIAVPTTYETEFIDLMKKASQEKMDRFLGESAMTVTPAVQMGNPYFQITERIAKTDTELVIMGTKGASGLKEFLIGSNAEKVVRKASCPVITLTEPSEPDNIKNIVFATNITDICDDLIAHVKQLQHMFKATIHIVRVNTPNNFKRDENILGGLEKMAERFMLDNYTINVYNDIYEDQGILSFANRIGGDMIAMGTHGRKGISHLLSGSLAEDIVNHAKRPIWTYHINA